MRSVAWTVALDTKAQVKDNSLADQVRERRAA
jgi:hypothetical protein